jgi:hypothetical protein
MLYEHEPIFDDGPNNDREIDTDRVKKIIISILHHLIFCDLTTGRSDNNLEPFDCEQVDEFIEENSLNIQRAAVSLFAIYQDEEKLYTLEDLEYDDPFHQDRFSEFLYEFVDTNGSVEDDDDDIDHFRDEEDFDDEE